MTAVYASLRVVAATCDGPCARRPGKVRIFPYVPDTLVARARDLAAQIMRGHPDRLRHLAAVAARADTLSVTVPTDRADALVAAAWLHDIGYAPALRQTGFHPLDGATHLRQEGWPDDVCALVAHHSGSRFVARLHGLDSSLWEFEFAEDAASDVLASADNTAGQDGASVKLTERLREKLQRHGPNSPGARANPERDDYIRAAARRVVQRLSEIDRTDAYLDV
jgi:predicted hydrolase (HD superfamily)